MPGPVTRIAPKPRRWISISPPILNEPDLLASSLGIIHPFSILPTLEFLGHPVERHEDLKVGMVRFRPLGSHLYWRAASMLETPFTED